ncbi:MAG: glucose-1-phosphate adenylyltransferase [bacterium]
MRNNILNKTLTIILAGGQGERLYPLTKDRAKPAVPFGGIYRIIDFTLSNCLNSGLRKVEVLTQYKSLSLDRHLRLAWNLFNYRIGEYINSSPPQQRLNHSWYRGTADAIYQNIYTLERARPDTVLILSGDHIYTMDYRRLLKFHAGKKADLTIGVIEMERINASPFGVLEKDFSDRVIGFQEKPSNPKPIPENPDRSIISMGIYVFNTEVLVKRVVENAKNCSSHDFGKDVIPAMVQKKDRVYVYNFKAPSGKYSYWRDIGTLDAYWQANMDLLSSPPSLNLYNNNWPLITYFQHQPPPKIVNAGSIKNAVFSNGCLINGASITDSILGTGVKIARGTEINQSIIMDNVNIGKNAKINRVIIDKNVVIPPGMQIDSETVKNQVSFTVTPGKVCVIPKEMPI